MAERKLATVRKISTISDIPGKDRIALAMVDGWSVIVQKAEFKPDDLCVFFEIDSVLPDAEWCSFLKEKRIRTMKMAGCLSQGIVFPLSIMSYYGGLIHEADGSIIGFSPRSGKDIYFKVGLDLTDIIGVKKWERPDAEDTSVTNPKSTASKKYPKWLMRWPWFRKFFVYRKDGLRASRAFPDFVRETDETRIQNAPFLLTPDNLWVLTEKLDGSSGTFAVRKEKHGVFKKEKLEFYVCSRKRRIFTDDGSSYWKVYNKYGIKNILTSLIEELNCNFVAIQGEVVGPKIQGNKYGLKEPDLFVFNFITDKDGRWSSADGKRLLESKGMKWVPIVGVGGLPKAVDDVLSLAHGKSKLADTLREGLVCRSMDGKQSFKAVDPEFLMKWCE